MPENLNATTGFTKLLRLMQHKNFKFFSNRQKLAENIINVTYSDIKGQTVIASR